MTQKIIPYKSPYLIVVFLFLILTNNSFSQSVYPNIDFENGNFIGWSAFTGECCPITTPMNGFISSRHTIMNGNGTDPYSLGQIPVVAPGGNYSVRLGNDSIHSQAEKFSYSFTVLPNAPLFIYRYAVVFQFPPAHPVLKQPRFEISVKDQNQNLIDCGFYQVTCPNNIPGFLTNGDYRFKSWTDVGVDLTDYIGQQITIEFATGDCGMGGHFGYAYIDAYATELKITNSMCNPDGSITLTAPPGFYYEWSNGESSQQITLTNPVGGTEVFVTLSSVTGCNKTISIIIPDFVPHPDFTFDLKCNYEITFQDESSVNNAAIINWIWNFGDGNFSNEINPSHQFSNSGNYTVSLTVQSDNNCKSSVTIPVDVKSPVKADFVFADNVCANDAVLFSDQSKTFSGNIISWFWNFDDSYTSSNQNPLHLYSHTGAYYPDLIVTTNEGCIDSVSKIIFIKGEIDCNPENEFSLFIPSAFSPNDDGLNDLFFIRGNNFNSLQLDIFDRWGKNIYSVSGKNISWNGKNFNQKNLPEGIFACRVVATDVFGKSHYYHSSVLLLR